MRQIIFLLALMSVALPAAANELKLDHVDLGSDMQTIQKGADTLMMECRSCHNLKYIKYRDMLAFGMDKSKVDEWRGEQPLDAALTSFMSHDDAMQMFGKSPPDLSLMTKARQGGADYVYSYLLGYYQTAEGGVGNHQFPETKMPDVLGGSMVTDPTERAALQEKARDIVSFLNWASDPHEQERHRLGFYVIGYLIVLTWLLYLIKVRIWARLD